VPWWAGVEPGAERVVVLFVHAFVVEGRLDALGRSFWLCCDGLRGRSLNPAGGGPLGVALFRLGLLYWLLIFGPRRARGIDFTMASRMLLIRTITSTFWAVRSRSKVSSLRCVNGFSILLKRFRT
jgi:hypothetical protein